MFGVLVVLTCPDVGLEGEPADFAGQRLDVVGVVRREPDGAAPARAAPRGDVAVAGAWTQCTYKVKRRYPLYRTIFSTAAEALTMVATGAVYMLARRSVRPVASLDLAEPLVGAIATYFFVNTGLVAGAIALSTGPET